MPMTMEKAQVTLPSDREVKVTRSFRAARPLVVRAYTAPALVQRWLLGPPGWSMPVCEMDVRVGGRYRWRWRSDKDAVSSASPARFAKFGRHRDSCTPKLRPWTVGDVHPESEALVSVTFTEDARHHDSDHADRLRVEGGAGRGGGNRHDRRHGAELSAARYAVQRARIAATMMFERLNRWDN